MLDFDITNILVDLIQYINKVPLPMLGVGGGLDVKESVDLLELLKFTGAFLLGIGGLLVLDWLLRQKSLL
jgi:hypothetical protein